MASIPFALSIHHFINSVGSDVGFASIIGLAILVLLYFAQARETASLREHADQAAGRIQQLEARVAQLSRTQAEGGAPPSVQASPAQAGAAQAPVGATAGASAPAQPAAARGAVPAQVPVAPAGVGAPALTAATRLIPAPVAAAAAAPAAAASTASPPAPPPAAQPQESGAVAVADRPASTTISPPPATVAGGANGGTQAPSRPAPRPTGPVAAARRPSAATISRHPQRQPRSQRTRLLLGAIGAVGVAVIIAVLLIITSSGGSHPSSTAAAVSNAPSATRASRPAGVAASSMTVSVLNGTASNGLAHRVAQKLMGAGYKEGTVETAPEQTHTSTIVAYLPGFRRDAQAVASSLKLPTSAIQPIDQNTQAVACPPPASCTTNVVVTVGADLTNTP